MSKPAVLHVYKDIYPPVVGGIEKHIDLVRRGMPDFESHVLCCSRGPRSSVRSSATGVEVHVAEFGRVLSLPVSPSFPAWARRIQADVVHVHMPFPLGELAALTLPKGVPVVASYHADIVRQAFLTPLYRPLAERFLRRTSAVLVSSQRVADGSAFLRSARPKIRVLPYAVDLGKYDPSRVSAERIREIRDRYGGPLVVAVGRLVYYKGLDGLIDAMSSIDAALLIIGEGPLRATLGAQARRNSRVHLLGEVPEDDLPTYFAAADCYVLASTSRAESFGIATLEAQAMGIPAVVTDVGTGTVDTIAHGVTGTVVPARDVPALAAAIARIVTDPARRRAMSEAARTRALTHFSHEAYCGRLRGLYVDLVGALQP